MKILMVNKFLHPNGGSETYIFKLGTYLTEQGHEVQYFGMEHEGRIVGNAVDSYTSDMDFHTGNRLSKVFYPIKTIYSTEARRKLRRVLEDFCPDVVHLNNFNYQLTPSVIIEIVEWRKKTGKTCRIVYTAHDGQLVCPNHLFKNPVTKELCEKCSDGKFLHCTKGRCIHGSLAKSLVGSAEACYWRSRKIYRHIDVIICCSAFMKSKLDHDPILAERTLVLHNFVDRIEWKETVKKDYVLYFGRFSEEKGIATLIRVCRRLPEIPFVFAGSGPLEMQISDVPNITNAGFRTGAELERLIREARFSVCPSEWYENCPFSVMESQMFGTPVLGADIGGIPELIQDSRTGELFRSSDEEDLKEKIETLWNDKEKTSRYSRNCRETEFDDMEQYCQKLLKIYRNE